LQQYQQVSQPCNIKELHELAEIIEEFFQDLDQNFQGWVLSHCDPKFEKNVVYSQQVPGNPPKSLSKLFSKKVQKYFPMISRELS
jgi:hypothetical protein